VQEGLMAEEGKDWCKYRRAFAPAPPLSLVHVFLGQFNGNTINSSKATYKDSDGNWSCGLIGLYFLL